MYFPTLVDGRLVRFPMTAMQTRQLRASRPPESALRWLEDTLNREGRQFGTNVTRVGAQDLVLHWASAR
jgi:hypothetical protein